MTKKCVSCNTSKYGLSYATDKDMPEWVKEKKNLKSIIPEYYMPSIDKIYQVDIDVKELKNTLIFYWATESQKMKKVSKSSKDCKDNCHPEYAYGNYCNSGISKLDKNGKCTIYVEEPIAYKAEGDNYYPHLHFTPFNDRTGKWEKEVFTVSIKNQLKA